MQTIINEKKNSTTSVIGLIKLIRPKQWIKNSFVLAPLVFSGLFTNLSSITTALSAMLLFCIASSATYIFNDYHDIELDRKHPKKSKERPLASGQVNKRQALLLLFVLYAALLFATLYQPSVLFVIGIYLIINVAYTITLKHQPVIDIFTIAFGFVLRIYAGATALSVPVSSWMFVTTLCLALYLAAVKRRQELEHTKKAEGRTVLKFYSAALLDRYAEMSATGTLLFYSLFVMTSHPGMVSTIPLVLFGLFRYWFITDSSSAGESPTDVLFSDKQLGLTILAWLGICIWSLWV